MEIGLLPTACPTAVLSRKRCPIKPKAGAPLSARGMALNPAEEGNRRRGLPRPLALDFGFDIQRLQNGKSVFYK